MINDTTRLLGLDGLVAEWVELDAAGVPVVDLSTGSMLPEVWAEGGAGQAVDHDLAAGFAGRWAAGAVALA
jgi:hypothetical protein